MEAHNHPNYKKVVNRLSRIVGHTQAIKRMVEEEKSCEDVLIQIAAVRSALNNVGRIILKDHLQHTLQDAIENGDDAVFEELDKALDKLLK